MKFVTKNSAHSTFHISYKKEYVEDIDNHINWKNDTEETIPKLHGASYGIRLMVHISIKNTLHSIYYAYVHSITEYGKIVWCNSTNSGRIFTLQKKIIRIMDRAQPTTFVEVYLNN
jgi:hypothetical protein